MSLRLEDINLTRVSTIWMEKQRWHFQESDTDLFQDGDNQRGRNQEAVLTAILNKAMSPAILLNASSIISSVSDSVETNMTSDEMAKFINMQLSEGARAGQSNRQQLWEQEIRRHAFLPDPAVICDVAG